MELPSDLTYGRVAQGKVSLLGRFARLAVMAHYMEAQYRATVAAARSAGRRRGARPLGDPDRPRRGARRPTPRDPQRDHDARRRRLRESGAGLRFPDPLVRPAAAALDPEPRERPDRDHRGLPPARPARRRSRALHPAHLQRHRSPPLQPLRQRQRGRSAIRAADDLRLPPALPPEGHPVPGRGGGPAEAAVSRAQAGARRATASSDPRWCSSPRSSASATTSPSSAGCRT